MFTVALVIGYFVPNMLIPLKKPEDDTVQWTLIEFHGTLKSIPKVDQACNIGNIYFESNGMVLMNIGNHVLEGKVMKLEKPIALIKKNIQAPNNAARESEGREYILKTIIRTKLIFLSRAKPLALNAH
ncbi:hypothetical protein QAD02_008643 [Eretmocerus hayati]|uniref:Uncharacterized protein n=1 Tax=Eretmocerus hayati TaxID=131215 RepID=A0ACC2N7D2_9HYME|nr:hypothetical protein QAD02_008643 [Eretmocerus hayati]